MLVTFSATLFLGAQERTRKKPVLIRADRTEPKVEVVEPDSAKAKEHIEVGDFYFKRHNYRAAVERYRDAVKYGPRMPEGYLKLVRALERESRLEEAYQACLQFADTNPDSERIAEFEKKAEKLKRKMGSPAFLKEPEES